MLLEASVVFAQGGQSPYTFQGVGELSGSSLIHNIGMGRVGIGSPTIWHLNNENPALLVHNNFTVFEMGLLVDLRRLRSDSLQQDNADGELSYIALGIPVISGKWTISGGFLPYSHVNYNISTTEFFTEDSITVATQFRGTGGLSQVYLSNGLKVHKNFTVGAKVAFLFGPITRETVISVEDNNLLNAIKERQSYSDLLFGGGISYSGKLNDETILNMGVIYDFSADIEGSRFRAQEQRTNDERLITSDTLTEGEPISVSIPRKFGFGMSYQKLNKFIIAADLEFQNWNDFEGPNGSNEGLENSINIAAGIEYIPDITSIDSYLARVTYRAGFSFEKSPFTLNSEQVNEFGINFGMSFPVGRFSRLNISMEAGQRGNNSDELIQEQFIKSYFGISFNDVPWKRRPIYD